MKAGVSSLFSPGPQSAGILPTFRVGLPSWKTHLEACFHGDSKSSQVNTED